VADPRDAVVAAARRIFPCTPVPSDGSPRVSALRKDTQALHAALVTLDAAHKPVPKPDPRRPTRNPTDCAHSYEPDEKGRPWCPDCNRVVRTNSG
jgi:hypothetical protein